MQFDYIFFDSGGTLYDFDTGDDPLPHQVASKSANRVHGLLSAMGEDVDFERLKKTIADQQDVCTKKLGKSYNFFKLIKAVIDELNLPLGTEAAACLADAFAGPRYASWLFPGTEDALRTLCDNGYRLGIIANTAWPGFSMDRAFAGVGLLPFFRIRIYSGDIGIEKPDPAIFRLAEQIGGLEGKRILYVGNDIEADIKGATAVGWSTAFRREGDITTARLADLEFDHICELVSYCLQQ